MARKIGRSAEQVTVENQRKRMFQKSERLSVPDSAES